MNIIESISRDGVNTTPKELAHRRMTTPRSGDIVDFGENEGEYPFTSGRYGRIWDTDSFGTGCITICCEMGSAFLHNDGSVDISGGPFATIAPEELTPTMELKLARYWNWGNNLPGADQGVYYTFERPVFTLKKRTEADKRAVDKRFQS